VKTPVLILLFPMLLLTACAETKIIEKPVPVYIDRVEYIPVPYDLTIKRNKTAIPETLTYGEALELWSVDRATIETLNGQMEAVESLGQEELPDSE
jgi:hypothetical protein